MLIFNSRKSTVLSALENGIYNHIPGDGREFVLCDSSAVSIQAEDGRSVTNVDISPFITNLPNKIDTKCFSTGFASGSTSQAANIIEAIEIGCKTLLIDEDKTATNFMCRDRFMEALMPKEKEPITPFISKVSALKKELDISSILVIGGLGEYFAVADCIIMLDNYNCLDVTEKAKEIINQDNLNFKKSDFGLYQFIYLILALILNVIEHFGEFSACRIPCGRDWYSISQAKVMSYGSDAIAINKERIELRDLYVQEDGQLALVKHLLGYLADNAKQIPIKELVNQALALCETDNSFDFCTNGYKHCSLSYAPPFIIAGTINRFRKLKIKI